MEMKMQPVTLVEPPDDGRNSKADVQGSTLTAFM